VRKVKEEEVIVEKGTSLKDLCVLVLEGKIIVNLMLPAD